MRYLGGLSGSGDLTCGDRTVARAEYDFDGYLVKAGQVVCSGEIRLADGALDRVFGRSDVTLVTDDGRHLSLRFSRLGRAGDAAHVDVAGELPAAGDWRH